MLITADRSADPPVQVRPELLNQVTIPPDWTLVTELQLDGDRLVVAQAAESVG